MVLMFLCLSCVSKEPAEKVSSTPPSEIDNVLYLSRGEDLNDVMATDIKVKILCLTSTSCKSCKDYYPVFKKVAKSFEGKPDVRFISFNIGFDDSVLHTYEIDIIPTTLIIKNGQTIKTLTGPGPEESLIKLIQKELDS